METLRTVLLMFFYYLCFTPMAMVIRKLRSGGRHGQGGLRQVNRDFGPKDFEEIF